jgi:hypothetical protein
MRTRHRMPMIFSLSMMDVFCCTLGCVILLWLVNQREAMLRSRAASEAGSQLTSTRAALAAADRDRDDLRRQLAAARADLDQSRLAAAEARSDLAAAHTKADDLTQQLADLRDRAADTEDRLAKKTLAEQQLTRQQTAARKQLDELERLVRDKELQNENAARRMAELTERLEQADARVAQLKKLTDALPDLRDAAASARESASAAEARVKALESELSDARGALDVARTESRELAGQISRMRVAADQRFEGIALTGKRVVFLVDMSGSMDMVDNNTRDAAKWPGVRDTVQKILRSLPQLERFQVLLFSDKATFLMGQEGRWFDFDPKASPERVKAALAAVEPKGNTNMYAALEATFQFRAQGLDTVYLLSDGLPNIGEGLTPQQAQAMTETQRTDVLSRAVRTALKTRWNVPQPGRPKVRINTIGFFFESPEVGAFLWALARENDGSFVGMSRP